MSKYDAIIIGAGHNGLAAAIHLATRGWKVAVVEAAAQPGGAVKTLELTEPGFRHDLCAMNLSMFAGSAFHAVYGKELQAHGLSLIPATNCFASVFRDGTYLGVAVDREETKGAIAAFSPEDAAAWSAMVEAFGTKAPHLFGLLRVPMPSFGSFKVLWGIWRAGGMPLLLDLARLIVSSPHAFLERHFKSEKLKTMMAAWGLHLDFPPNMPGGALFVYLESMINQTVGMVIGSGGADTMIRSMVSLLKARGGEVMLSSPVEKVLLDDGRAKGVILRDKQTLRASRAVISNVHPKRLFQFLVGNAPSRHSFETAISSYRAGPGAMMIHLAMEDLPDWSASDALRRFAYIHLAPDMAMMNRVYCEALQGMLPAEPVLVVGQPTAIDPRRAPPGRHVLWIQVRVLPATICGDAKDEIRAVDWQSAKDAYAERVLDIVESYAPGFKSKIRACAVYSPDDLERENPNLIGGDSLSGSHHLDQNFLFRPVMGYSRYNTPVKGLYICGAATWPGAGTGAGSGFMLAKMLTS